MSSVGKGVVRVAELVRFELEDGSEVFFESAGSDLVALHGGAPEVSDAGVLGDRLRGVAAAAAEVSRSVRSQLSPDEVALEFGVKIAGEVNWWFFAKNAGEATIKVTCTWKGKAETPPAAATDAD